MTRSLVARWRALTGGSAVRDQDRPTLVALSGGSDSSGLLIALASVKPARLVAAHIRHDLRPEAERNRDADLSRQLAHKLGVAFCLADISIPAEANAEGTARSLRYEALASIARQSGCRYIATAHHAEDQLETMLMAMTRGTGLQGLAGIAESRSLESGLELIRPALRHSRDDLRFLCDDAKWTPAHDATNEDITRTRARVRAEVLPALLDQAGDGLPDRLASLSELLRQSQQIVEERAERIADEAQEGDNSLTLPLNSLCGERPVVIGEVLRTMARQLVGVLGEDARGSKHLKPVIECIRSSPEHAKVFELKGLRVRVTSRAVEVRAHSSDR